MTTTVKYVPSISHTKLFIIQIILVFITDILEPINFYNQIYGQKNLIIHRRFSFFSFIHCIIKKLL